MADSTTVGLGQLHLFLMVGQISLAALIVVALFFFYRVYRHHYLLHWGLSWSAYSLFLIGSAVSSLLAVGRPEATLLRAVVAAASVIAGYLQMAWLVLGTWELANRRDAPRRVTRGVVLLGLGISATSLVFFNFGLLNVRSIAFSSLSLRWVLASTVYLAAAMGVLWSSRRRPAAFGRRMMGITLVACGLDHVAYLFVAIAPGLRPGGAVGVLGIFDLATMAGLGLAVVTWLLEDERERLLHAVEETNRRERAQAYVYRISEAAHTVRDLPELFRSIHATIAEAIPAGNFYIALLDRESNTLSFPYFVDEHDPAPEPRPLGRGLTEYVLRSRVPLLGTRDVVDGLSEAGEVETIGTPSEVWLGVPLLSGGEAIGVAVVQAYDPAVRVGEEERGFLVFVSEQVAAAIEAKRAEEALRLGESRLRQVVDLVPHFIFAKDSGGRFLLVNRAVAEAYGTTVEELLGEVDAGFLEEAERRRAGDLEVIASGEPKVIAEEPITDARGHVRWLQTTKIPFTFSGTGSPAVLGVSLDITQRKLTEETLRRAAKEESLSVLAGGVAHDFNNLLAALLGHISLALAKLVEGEEAREHIERAALTVERAAVLTRQMLAYSGRGTFFIRPTDLGNLVRETLPLLEVGLPKRVRLVTHLAEDLPLVSGDEGQLQQVLMNLVINGAEAIGDRGGTVTVATAMHELPESNTAAWQLTETALAAGTYVLLEVVDDGPGIEGETLERIFDPFFSTKFTGRGLGLAAVLGIMRGHGGGLSVESSPGRGTSFRLLFPLDASEHVEEVVALEPASGERLGILVIDDEDAVREVVAEVLEFEGFGVVTAEDGLEGVAMLRERASEIDAVLLDLSMPGLSGEETFTRLQDARPGIPVVLSSGYDSSEAFRRFPGQGPAGFIQKPYRPAELVAELHRCVNAARGPGHE